jgi:hypothetical protein
MQMTIHYIQWPIPRGRHHLSLVSRDQGFQKVM